MQNISPPYKSPLLLLIKTHSLLASLLYYHHLRIKFSLTMAKRLATLAALLAVLLVGATARTTVTTVEVDEDANQGRSLQGGCRQQIQQQGQLRDCHDFLRQQALGGSEFDPSGRWGGRQSQYGQGSQYDPRRGSQYGGRGSQYGGRGSQYGSQQFERCCEELRELDNQCRCEGLRQIVRREQQQQQGRFRGQGQELEHIARVARNLPQQCGVGPQFCDIRAFFL